MIKCKICNTETLKLKFLKIKSISHVNFNEFTKPSYYKCKNCNIIQNQNVKNIFSTNSYYNLNQSDLYIYRNNLKIKKSDFQSKFIFKNLKIKKNNLILDYGCNKGDLLKSFKKIYNIKNLFGYEINNKFVSLIKQNKFKFDDFYKSNQKFDIIIFSHSLFYVKNLKKLFLSLGQKLNKNGKIYIENPDIIQNPIYSAIGDQAYFFTKKNSINLLNYFNFDAIYKKVPFSDNFCLIVKKSTKSFKKFKFKDNNFEKSLNMLNRKIKKLILLKKKYFVFGTTSKAAFVETVLKKKIIKFVDENMFQSKKRFRNKQIIHPKELKDNNIIIVPTSKKKLIDKLRNNYKGKFINV